jgi:hypothetical protein
VRSYSIASHQGDLVDSSYTYLTPSSCAYGRTDPQKAHLGPSVMALPHFWQFSFGQAQPVQPDLGSWTLIGQSTVHRGQSISIQSLHGGIYYRLVWCR